MNEYGEKFTIEQCHTIIEILMKLYGNIVEYEHIQSLKISILKRNCEKHLKI